MRLMLAGAVAALAIATAPQNLLAQRSGVMIGPTSASLRASAALRPLPSMTLAAAQPRLLAEVADPRGGRRQGEILMIVGGAVMVTGLLVDESLVTIAGVAVGGYGLYLYLRATR